MVRGSVDLLRTTAGEAALAAAHSVVGDAGGDPLVGVSTLRAQGIAPDLAGLALRQAMLRRRARTKFGVDAERMYFTAPGLEQATRREVADRRAARLVAAGATRVADLGCGIGSDTLAFARAGLHVLAVEADGETAAVAAANAAALDLAGRVDVVCADATVADLSDVDAVFCDPARRSGVRRVFDPAAYAPPWQFVRHLPERVPATVLKLAPGIDHALLPPGAEAEWVSVDGAVVEAALWFGPLARAARRATVIRAGAPFELTGTGEAEAPVGRVGRFLFDPDGAVIRSHLVAEFAARVGGRLADPRIAYVFADAASTTPLARCFEVLDEVPYGLKRLRAELRRRDIGRLEIRKRGLAVDPDRLRRELRLAGGLGATLVLARFGDTPVALLCSPTP
jgi:SAM-dependent methyltransferase